MNESFSVERLIEKYPDLKEDESLKIKVIAGILDAMDYYVKEFKANRFADKPNIDKIYKDIKAFHLKNIL